MSATAYTAPTPSGTAGDVPPSARPPAAMPDRFKVPQELREFDTNARNDRRRVEHTWQLCQSFLQGQQWVGWNWRDRRVVELPNKDDRVRVTVNVLTQYLRTFMGKMTADEFLPDIRFRRDDQISRAYARQAKRAVEWGWEEEWEGDEKVMEALNYLAAFGLGGLRVRPDPAYGPVVDSFPLDSEGKLHVTDKHDFMAQSLEQGTPYDMHELREGRLCLDPFSPFNLLPPPGVFHERDFPMFAIERPVPLTTIKALWPEAGQYVREEQMRVIDLVGVREDMSGDGGQAGGRMRGHANLKTFFRTPTPDRPEGEQMLVAGDVLLEQGKPLPFQIRGQGKAGVVLFKYTVVPGRFWPIGMVEPGVSPQRQRNRARSQWIEMKDRAGLGRVYAHKGAVDSVSRPKGGIFELVEVKPGQDFPKETQGVPPGQWLAAEVAQNDGDLNAVMGIQDVSLGQAPAGVSAFSAFALLAEQDDRRIGPTLRHVRLELAKLTKVLLAGMKTYWVPGKMIPMTGEEGDELLDSFLFDASKLPVDAYVKIGKGAPMPQTQAAEVQKIFDIFDRSISSGQALPLKWLADSLAQGKALPVPEAAQDMQNDAAKLENNLMAQGVLVPVRPYDADELHIQQHREFESTIAFVPQLANVVQLVEQHIQAHQQQIIGKQQLIVTPGAPNPAGLGAVGGTGGQAGAAAGTPGAPQDAGGAGGVAQLRLEQTNRLSPRPPSMR